MSRSLYARLTQRYRPNRNGITRREALKITLAASAGLLLSSCAPMSRKPSVGKRILIIGAGFSGLAAAHELRAAGFDITVVEARNRVSGRVRTFEDMAPGKTVEGGGELIGSNHPTWVAYADRFGLEFNDVTEAEDLHFPVLLSGQLLDEAQTEKLWEEMDAAKSTMNADAEKVNANEPWLTAGAAELDKRNTADWIMSQKIAALSKQALIAEFTGDNGAAVEKQSYLGNLTQVKGGGVDKYWTDSEVYRCKGGNQQLAMKLAKSIGHKNILLNAPVTQIQVTETGATVTLADGRKLQGDDVILTVPPSVWRKIKIDPGLPSVLAPQMGTNVKYLSAVKNRFWKEKGLAPDSLTDGPVSMTWECTDNQGGDGTQAVLSAFSGGPPASTCRSWIPEVRDRNYSAELNHLYPGYVENLISTRFMDWPGEQWTLAGYSFPAPGQVTTQGPMLHKGFGRLHFAGEHTCYKFVGYMEGALNSGVSLAKRLAQRDGALLKA